MAETNCNQHKFKKTDRNFDVHGFALQPPTLALAVESNAVTVANPGNRIEDTTAGTVTLLLTVVLLLLLALAISACQQHDRFLLKREGLVKTRDRVRNVPVTVTGGGGGDDEDTVEDAGAVAVEAYSTS